MDGVLVLEKEKRVGNKAKLTIANRDTESYCFKLEFDPDVCKWLFIGNDGDGDDKSDDSKNKILITLMGDFIKGKDAWKGTATELYNGLKALDENFDITAAEVAKRLRALESFFKEKLAIAINFSRSKDKVIFIERADTQQALQI